MDKPDVYLGKVSIQACKVNNIFIRDWVELFEILHAKPDRSPTLVFDAHGQSVGTADDGPGIVNQAGSLL